MNPAIALTQITATMCEFSVLSIFTVQRLFNPRYLLNILHKCEAILTPNQLLASAARALPTAHSHAHIRPGCFTRYTS